jgi:SagB-type dehydrogenase family enzyme
VAAPAKVEPKEVALPTPEIRGTVTVEEALLRRRSVREFDTRELTQVEVGQLLWAGQGITNRESGARTAPSAGAIYPLTLYVVQRDGVWQYLPAGHRLRQLATDDRRVNLAKAAGDQGSVRQGAATLVIAGSPARLKERYGVRAERFLWLEAGHAAENVLLQAVALHLGAVPVGAFDDHLVAQAVGLPEGQAPLYLIPVGYPVVR